MAAKKDGKDQDYDLDDFDYDGDETLREEKEDIETEYTPEDFEDEYEEEFDTDHDYSED